MGNTEIDKYAAILQKLYDESEKVVFFGGAGVSTESGIPDFRSRDGLYNQKYDVPPETILSHTYFMKDPEGFYKFYRDKMLPEGILPNAAHKKLAEMESSGKLTAVVTQNIDTLHRDAGSCNVLELHGTVSSYHCMKCTKKYSLPFVRSRKGVPYCECGGIVKPDVVLYEEALDGATCTAAVKAISEADMLIVAGTSLTVYPAAGMIDYYKGDRLVLINRDKTARDNAADYVFHCSVGELLSKIKA